MSGTNMSKKIGWPYKNMLKQWNDIGVSLLPNDWNEISLKSLNNSIQFINFLREIIYILQ